MPAPVNSGAQARRVNRPKKRAPQPSRSDAAQRVGARTPPPPAVQRGHASEGGRTIRPATRRPVSRSDAAQGNRTSDADAFKRSWEYNDALAAARRARLRRNIAQGKPFAPVAPSRPTMRAPSLDSIVKFLQGGIIPNTGGGPGLAVRAIAPRGSATALVSPRAVQLNQSQFTRNLTRDLVQFGPQSVVGGLALGKAGYQAARSNTGPLETIGRGALSGLQETFTHPLRSLEEQPLNTLLTFGGATTVAGRSAGALARAGGRRGTGARGALDRVGTTVRPPIALVDDAGVVRNGQGLVERTYSKDLTRKAAQVAADRRREPLRDAEGKPVTVNQRGREVPVFKATTKEREGGLLPVQGGGRPGLAAKQTDFEAGRANAVERYVRQQADLETPQGVVSASTRRASERVRNVVTRETDRELSRRGIRGRRNRDAVALVVEGTIRSAKTFETDLRRHRQRLNNEYRQRIDDQGFRHSGERQANRDRVKQITALLRTTPEQREQIVAMGTAVGRQLNETEKGLLRAGVLSDAERAKRARLMPAAIEHMGARHVTEAEHRALARQGGPSGRNPRKVQRQRRAQSAVARAKETERLVEDRLARVRRQRSEVTGANRVRRGQESQKGPLRTYILEGNRYETREAAAAALKRARAEGRSPQIEIVARSIREAVRTGESARLRRAERALREELARARRLRRAAERQLARTPRPETRAGLRREGGGYLSTKEIEQSLRAMGRDPDTIAYLPHRMDVRGKRSHHARNDATRPVMDKPELRTGEAYRKGATESSAELIREQGVRQRVQLAKAEQLDRLVENSGVKHPDGRYFTWKEAQELSERIDFDTRVGADVFVMRNGQKMVPIRAHGAKLSPETQKMIQEERQGPGAMENLHKQLLNDRILHAPEGRNARNVVLVPAAKIDQMQQHLRPTIPLERFFQLMNRPFRMAVLPQPRWLTGNFVEPYVVRLTVKGSGLNVFGLGTDLVAAHKAMRVMERSGDPRVRRAAQEIRASQFGGLFVGGNQARAVRRGLEDFPRLERAYGNVVSKLPVVEQAAELGVMLGRGLVWPLRQFFNVNRVIESVAQRAAFGKQLRADLQEFTGSWAATVRLHNKAVEQATRGLVNTPTQQRFMRAQQELLGKYEGYGPIMRSLIQGPMPFLPWVLNAARFIYWTMPAQHTAVQAVLSQVNQVVAKDWEQIHANVPPGGLKFALPTEKGGWVDIARYTPYGLVTGGEGTVTGQVFPQIQGAVKAVVSGQDPFGRDLQVDPSENKGETAPTPGQRRGIAAYSLAEAMVPYLSTARRLREQGGTAYAGSTIADPDVKPATVGQMSAVRRVFDPFRPTYFGAGPARGNEPATPQEQTPTDPADAFWDQIAADQEAARAEQAVADDFWEKMRR